MTLLHQATLQPTYWSLAFQTAVYLINYMTTPLNYLKSTLEILFKSSPNYLKLRVFGCLCFPWLKPYSQHKMDPKSRPCIFVGYSTSQSAYKCLDPITNWIFISKHVKFDESIFPSPSQPSVPPPVQSMTNP